MQKTAALLPASHNDSGTPRSHPEASWNLSQSQGLDNSLPNWEEGQHLSTLAEKMQKIAASLPASHNDNGTPSSPPRGELASIPVHKTGNHVALSTTSPLLACNSKPITPGEIPKEIQAYPQECLATSHSFLSPYLGCARTEGALPNYGGTAPHQATR